MTYPKLPRILVKIYVSFWGHEHVAEKGLSRFGFAG